MITPFYYRTRTGQIMLEGVPYKSIRLVMVCRRLTYVQRQVREASTPIVKRDFHLTPAYYASVNNDRPQTVLLPPGKTFTIRLPIPAVMDVDCQLHSEAMSAIVEQAA